MPQPCEKNVEKYNNSSRPELVASFSSDSELGSTSGSHAPGTRGVRNKLLEVEQALGIEGFGSVVCSFRV